MYGKSVETCTCSLTQDGKIFSIPFPFTQLNESENMITCWSLVAAIIFSLIVTGRSYSDFEIRAIHDMRKHRNIPRKPMLCAVLSNPSPDRPVALSNLKSTMQLLSSYCEFAVLSPNCSIGALSSINSIALDSSASFQFYRCLSSDEYSKLEYRSSHIPKAMLFERMHDMIRGYKRLMILGDMINLTGFDIRTFLRIADCSYYPRLRPLIFQAIQSSSRGLKFWNVDYWATKGVIAAPVEHLDTNMMLIDTAFFDWFIRSIVKPLLQGNSVYSYSGFDTIFCRSASLFAKRVYLNNYDDKRYVACALVTLPHTAFRYDDGIIREPYVNPFDVSITTNLLLKTLFPSFYSRDTFLKKDMPGETVKYVPSTCPITKNQFNYTEYKYEALNYVLNSPKFSRSGLLDWESGMQPENGDVESSKIYALYFPQFHKDKINDKLWGPGFTDWDNVAKSSMNRNGKHVALPSIFGYYDLMDIEVRRKQGALAKYYGVDGFIYHHYYFYEKGMSATLAGPLECLLRDNEPNISFALHWANLDWTVTWQGKLHNSTTVSSQGNIIQRQYCPGADDPLVLEHYQFLKRLFHHPNYILVSGAPLFLLYRHNNPSCVAIVNKLRLLAIEDGFPSPGLHIPQFRHNIDHEISVRSNVDTASTSSSSNKYMFSTTKNDAEIPTFNSDLYYPGCHSLIANRIPQWCLLGHHSNMSRPSYLSVITTFDNTPRRQSSDANIWDRSWSDIGTFLSFERDLVETMVYEMCCQREHVRESGGKFVVVNAWNEWAEGMILEPSQRYGRRFLESISNAQRLVRSIGCNFYRLSRYTSSLKMHYKNSEDAH